LDLIDAFCSDEDLPADINWSMMAFLEENLVKHLSMHKPLV